MKVNEALKCSEQLPDGKYEAQSFTDILEERKGMEVEVIDGKMKVLE